MMRRLSFALLLSLLLTGLVQAQSSDLLTSFASRANLRAGGSPEWRILGTYDAGTPIRLDGQAFDGQWVRGIVPDGTVGWVLTESLNISADQAAGLRGIWVEDPFTLAAPAGAAPPPPATLPSAPDEAAAAAPQPAPVVSSGGSFQTTVANRVNMRVNPNERVIRTLGFQEAVTVDGRHPNNAWVRVITADGARGWIAVDFVIISAQQFQSLPVVEGGAIETGAGSADTSAPEAEAAPPVVNTAPVSGFSYGGHVADLGPSAVNRMHQAGMTWLKRQWRYLRGQDAGAVAGWINQAHANGFRILVGIVGLPQELNGGGYASDYANFVAGVAALGADGIEVWNEPNIDREWPNGQISPQNYTNLLSQAYSAIKAANSNTLVISGAPAPTGFFGGCFAHGCDDDAFVRGMAAAGAANVMDCIGVHYNEGIVSPDATSGDPRGNSSHYSRYFWGMMNTYTGAFGGARPLCFTELGYLTPEGFPPLPGGFAWAQNVSLAQHAAWLDRAINLAGNSGRVRLLIVWNVDFRQYGADPMAGYAIIRPDGSCPACEALGR